MDKVKEFVEDNNLETLGTMGDAMFAIELNNSDDFSSIYQRISDNFDDAESGEADENSCHFVFTDGEIEITCDANYQEDNYTFTIMPR